MEEQVNQTSQNNLLTAKQEFIDETESAINIPESLKTDTGHPLQQQVVSNGTSQQGINLDANLQHDQLQDEDKQDTIIHDADVLHDDYDHTAIDNIADGTTIQMEKPITKLFPVDNVTIPNEKVGCVFVTIPLQQFLEGYPPPSDKQAFLDIYHMLSLLDKYLYDNPKQHTHCMSPDNAQKHISYCLGCTLYSPGYPRLQFWIYNNLLQEEYNRYYKSRSRKYMEKLKKKSIAIQNHMHDSVSHDFDRDSDYCDDGLIPLQGQQDEQPEAVNSAENAIEHDTVDILTEYPPWSRDTYVMMMKLFMIEIEKRYKMNYLKTHQLKLKTISPIQIMLMPTIGSNNPGT